MKATGIVRRIDDLGRVVIPKEIRRTMRIREGDPLEIYTDREGVMGVDLNDEATSLMTYQKAYTAACRLMTVLEEALDSLINGTVV